MPVRPNKAKEPPKGLSLSLSDLFAGPFALHLTNETMDIALFFPAVVVLLNKIKKSSFLNETMARSTQPVQKTFRNGGGGSCDGAAKEGGEK